MEGEGKEEVATVNTKNAGDEDNVDAEYSLLGCGTSTEAPESMDIEQTWYMCKKEDSVKEDSVSNDEIKSPLQHCCVSEKTEFESFVILEDTTSRINVADARTDGTSCQLEETRTNETLIQTGNESVIKPYFDDLSDNADNTVERTRENQPTYKSKMAQSTGYDRMNSVVKLAQSFETKENIFKMPTEKLAPSAVSSQSSDGPKKESITANSKKHVCPPPGFHSRACTTEILDTATVANTEVESQAPNENEATFKTKLPKNTRFDGMNSVIKPAESFLKADESVSNRSTEKLDTSEVSILSSGGFKKDHLNANSKKPVRPPPGFSNRTCTTERKDGATVEHTEIESHASKEDGYPAVDFKASNEKDPHTTHQTDSDGDSVHRQMEGNDDQHIAQSIEHMVTIESSKRKVIDVNEHDTQRSDDDNEDLTTVLKATNNTDTPTTDANDTTAIGMDQDVNSGGDMEPSCETQNSLTAAKDNDEEDDEKKRALEKVRYAHTNDDDFYPDDGNGYFTEMKKANGKFVYFWRCEDVFSQWHKSKFEVDGRTFTSAEQYMMFKKAGACYTNTNINHL